MKPEIIINCAEWGPGYLLRSKYEIDYPGCKCCLGFAALACGATEQQIEGHQMPHSIITNKNDFALMYFIEATITNFDSITIGKEASWVNDSFFSFKNSSIYRKAMYPITKRRLITLFKEMGYVLKFQGRSHEGWGEPDAP